LPAGTSRGGGAGTFIGRRGGGRGERSAAQTISTLRARRKRPGASHTCHPRRWQLHQQGSVPGIPRRGCGSAAHVRGPEKAVRRLIAIHGQAHATIRAVPWTASDAADRSRPTCWKRPRGVIEAIEAGDVTHHKEELGHLLFNVVFQSRIARGKGSSTSRRCGDAISTSSTRHPHVFGDRRASPAPRGCEEWEREGSRLTAQAKGRVPAIPPSGLRSGCPAAPGTGRSG